MQPLPHLPIPSGLWSAPTRMEVKCFLFAAFFLVACVAFSSQDELTDVEGKSKSTLFKIVFSSPFHHSTFIVSTMFSTKKQQQQLTTTIYRAKKSAFTNFILFCINVKIFFPFILWFSPFLFIFKRRHSNKQRTMVNGYSYHHRFVFFCIEPLRIRFHLQQCICAYLRARFPLTKFFFTYYYYFFIFCVNVDVQSPELTCMYILSCSHEFLTKSMNRP